MVRQDIETTFSVGFGKSRTGKTVTASVLDTAGVVLSSGVTIGTVIELGHGVYGVAMTFTIEFAGYIKWNNTTDTVTNYFPIVVKDDLTKIRKIMTNRWKITGNQLLEYDDDGTTVLNTYDLKNLGVADGATPDERVPV